MCSLNENVNINEFVIPEQWFSTFLSLRHTNFENKFGGTLMRDRNDENRAFRILL